MSKNKFVQSANRRAFLGKVTGAAALMGVSSLVNPASANDGIQVFTRDADDPEEWFRSVKGKHRMVFDVTEPKEIFPFAWPKIYMMTNAATGAPATECTAVVVLRHSGMCFALQDNMWAKYKFGEMFKVTDPQTKAAAIRNPFWKPKPDDFSAPGPTAIGGARLHWSRAGGGICRHGQNHCGPASGSFFGPTPP